MFSLIRAEYRAILGIVTLYFFGHLLILFNRGFWSDGLHLIASLNNGSNAQLWAHLGQYKSYALYYTLTFLKTLPYDITLLLKWAGFLNWMISGIVVYLILRRVLDIPNTDSFFVVSSFLLFASFPFKGELAYLHFSIDSMLFFIGVLVYFLSQEQTKTWLRYVGYSLAILLFFISFTTNSILVFYGGFLLLQLYKFHQKEGGSFSKSFDAWLGSNFFFILLPVVYWYFQLSLGRPYGELGAGYNSFVFFKSGFLSKLFDDVWSFIAYGFFWPIIAPLTILQRRIFAGLLIIFIAAVYLIKRTVFSRVSQNSSSLAVSPKPRYYILSGLLWFTLGAFPYVAVGAYPTIFGDGFHMRYAILLPLGSSLIILGVIKSLLADRWQDNIQTVIIALFIVFNIYNYWHIDMDWYRQKAIVASLRDTKFETIRKASTLVFYDELRDLKLFGRGIKTAEYRLYLQEAFPGNFKFALAIGDVGKDGSIDNAITTNYNRFRNIRAFYYPKEFDPLHETLKVAVVTNSDKELMTVRRWLRLKRYELFTDKENFINKLKEELQIEVVPFVPSQIINDA